MQTESKSGRFNLAMAMFIFGTIGIFRNYIPLSSSWLSMLRGLIGVAFLAVVVKVTGKGLDWGVIRKNLPMLVISGILIGLNWILLFEAYRYTSVAIATLCYYMAPVMVILASPLVLGEKLTVKKAACAAIAVVGMVFVSGILEETGLEPGAFKGIGLGLGAALLYACVILMNKKLPAMRSYDKTMVQLLAAALVLLPYNLLLPGESVDITWMVVALVAVVGIVHTGIAYALYFGAIGSLKAQTVAIYSYIDPVTAIILSLIVFQEKMGVFGILGAVLILGSTLVSDLLE